MVRADERRMQQVLINLLSNAVKFTPAGGEVRLTRTHSTAGLAIAIRDTGIGMTADDIGKAMEPFGQINSKISRRYEGSGLGLPLAKHLIELHGGSISIQSEIDRGTTVTIALPSERILSPKADGQKNALDRGAMAVGMA
jgi:signal transduction histidine kinase